MSDIRIHREHALGLEQARKVAWQWAEQVEKRFDMVCTFVEGEFSDTVQFKRLGVHGELIVAADHFDLHAKLGFLLGAFSRTIETEIQKELESLLGKAGKGGAVAKAKAAATRTHAAGKTAKAAAPAKKAARK